ncbi:hypothetical protein [Jingyaoa shaoxingensis]|uniref:Uncharacterized protein n=1 Tax=Jingyaoa shaoxingensis TaxID=2763671 RepID=A0ABR7N6E2_9FIRM|nr:hypothetical protein [Jingyaoa shaoxingensis]MBC8571919.1 hypothetical protein [Jingyaoa shaoxingensis]
MREMSRYQMNVAVVTSSLRMRSGKDSPEAEAARVWKKFSETKQEPVKMATALWGFFLKDGGDPESKRAYAEYLKPRIRNAVETLIEEDEPDKIEVLEQAGWFGQKEVEDFIRTARERQKLQALVYLMKLKDTRYGYQEEEWEL